MGYLLKSIIPADRLVMRTAFWQIYRLRDPAHFADLIIIQLCQVGNGMISKKFGSQFFCSRFLGQRLGTVFTILGNRRAVVIRIGPGAARAIKNRPFYSCEKDLPCP